MSNQLRYLDGDTAPILLPFNPSYPIMDGDLVYRHPADGSARSAAQMPNQGSQAANQDAFQEYFAGVSMMKCGLQPNEKSFRLVTNPNYVVVATAGKFAYPCASHQWNPGDYVGVHADNTGAYPQEVDPVATNNLAIGVAVPGPAAITEAVTEIAVKISSTLMKGAVQDSQNLGSGSGL